MGILSAMVIGTVLCGCKDQSQSVAGPRTTLPETHAFYKDGVFLDPRDWAGVEGIEPKSGDVSIFVGLRVLEFERSRRQEQDTTPLLISDAPQILKLGEYTTLNLGWAKDERNPWYVDPAPITEAPRLQLLETPTYFRRFGSIPIHQLGEARVDPRQLADSLFRLGYAIYRSHDENGSLGTRLRVMHSCWDAAILLRVQELKTRQQAEEEGAWMSIKEQLDSVVSRLHRENRKTAPE